MRLMACLLMSLSIGAASAALAEETPAATPMTAAPAAEPVAATQASTPTAPAATATSTATPAKPASTPVADASDAQIKMLRGQGYKPETRNGVTVYCRKEAQLGSHFESKVCGSPQDLAQIALDSKEITNKIQQTRLDLPHN